MSEKLELVITLDNGQFKVAANQSAEQIDKIKSKTKGMLDTLAGTSASVGSIAKLATVWGAVGVGIDLVVGALKAAVNAIGEWMSAGVRNAAKMEQWALSFEVMFKSAEKSKKMMSDLKAFADKTPFNMPTVVEGAKRLTAMGIAQKDLLGVMKDLGNAAGGEAEKFNDLVLAYGKAASKGKVTAEEFNMFAERVGGIGPEMAKVMGIAPKELYKIMEQGKVGFSVLDKALNNLTNRGGAFAGMLAKQGQSLSGLTSTLSDAWESLKTEFGIGISSGLKEFISALTLALGSTGELKDAAKNLGEILGKAFSWAAGKVLYLNTVFKDLDVILLKIQMVQSGMYGAAGVDDSVQAGIKARQAGKERNIGEYAAYSALEKSMRAREDAEAAYARFERGGGIAGPPLGDSDKRDLKKGDVTGGPGGAGKKPSILAATPFEEALQKAKEERSQFTNEMNAMYADNIVAYKNYQEQRNNIEIKFGGENSQAKLNALATLDKNNEEMLKKHEEFNKAKLAIELKYAGEIAGATVDLYNNVTGVVQGALGQIGEMHKQELDGRIQKMNFWANVAKAYINANVTDEAERERQIAQIDNAREIRELMMKRRAAMQEKQFKIASAIMNTFSSAAGAASAMAGIPYVGPFLAIAAAAGMVALGMAQVRMIQATPLPLMETGAFDVPRTTPAIIHEGETVIPKNFTDSIKAGDISISGGDSNRTINLVVDGRTLATVVDNHRSKKAASMGASNYAFGGVYR